MSGMAIRDLTALGCIWNARPLIQRATAGTGRRPSTAASLPWLLPILHHPSRVLDDDVLASGFLLQVAGS